MNCFDLVLASLIDSDDVYIKNLKLSRMSAGFADISQLADEEKQQLDQLIERLDEERRYTLVVSTFPALAQFFYSCGTHFNETVNRGGESHNTIMKLSIHYYISLPMVIFPEFLNPNLPLIIDIHPQESRCYNSITIISSLSADPKSSFFWRK